MTYTNPNRKKKVRLTAKGKAMILGFFLILMLAAVIAVCARSFFGSQNNSSRTDGNPRGDVIVTEPDNEETETEDPESEPESGEGSEEAVPEENTEPEVSRISEIYQADNGCWYVDIDGISLIIANKQYSLTRDWGSDYSQSTEPYKSAYDALMRMFSDAAAAGYTLDLVSGYRSYDTQYAIHQRYTNEQGEAAADLISAEAGQSEHQTGMAFDVLSNNYSRLNAGFDQTAECQWMMEHAWEYGFILRYLPDKTDETGYSYEPWHYRYVESPELAKEIKDSGKSLEDFLGILP